MDCVCDEGGVLQSVLGTVSCVVRDVRGLGFTVEKEVY